jgi:hypothetical protein
MNRRTNSWQRSTIVLLLAGLLAVLGTAHAATPATPTATKVGALDQARIDAAKKAYTLYEVQFTSGTATTDTLFTWSRRWYEAEHDAGIKTAGADHLARVTKIQALVAKKVTMGMASTADGAAADYFVAEAQLWK